MGNDCTTANETNATSHQQVSTTSTSTTSVAIGGNSIIHPTNFDTEATIIDDLLFKVNNSFNIKHLVYFIIFRQTFTSNQLMKTPVFIKFHLTFHPQPQNVYMIQISHQHQKPNLTKSARYHMVKQSVFATMKHVGNLENDAAPKEIKIKKWWLFWRSKMKNCERKSQSWKVMPKSYVYKFYNKFERQNNSEASWSKPGLLKTLKHRKLFCAEKIAKFSCARRKVKKLYKWFVQYRWINEFNALLTEEKFPSNRFVPFVLWFI